MGKVLCEAPKSNLMPPKNGHSKSRYSSRPTVDPVLIYYGLIYISVSDRILKPDNLGVLVKSPASSGIPQEGVDFPGVQFLGSTSRQKPSYRHPRARVPMLSMVEYSCTVQLFRTAVLCHVINRSVTSSDTSS